MIGEFGFCRSDWIWQVRMDLIIQIGLVGQFGLGMSGWVWYIRLGFGMSGVVRQVRLSLVGQNRFDRFG